jgi:prepilin-type N-terminal cleavage/methylation domain-containing protein
MNHQLTVTASPHTAVVDPHRSGRARGVTLIELMVVLVVVGLGALVVLENMNSMYRKYELESSATALASLIDSTASWAKEEHTEVYLIWDPGNNQVAISRQSDGSEVLDEFRIPDYLVLSPNDRQVLRCDTLGRAFNGTDTKMLNAVLVMTATHNTMLDGRVNPAITFTLSLSPLWHVTSVKSLS